MEQQQGFDSMARGAARPKKAYVTPELQGWGSITDLTQGGKAGLEDFPKEASGTRPV